MTRTNAPATSEDVPEPPRNPARRARRARHAAPEAAQVGPTYASTQKPVECMARAIRNHGKKGDHVFEPFMGSGSTLIACEQLGRRSLGVEIDPRYCDAIVRRFEGFTGSRATLEGGAQRRAASTPKKNKRTKAKGRSS